MLQFKKTQHCFLKEITAGGWNKQRGSNGQGSEWRKQQLTNDNSFSLLHSFVFVCVVVGEGGEGRREGERGRRSGGD